MRFRKIIHLDLDAFFCSVEELLNPELIGLPFAVGGKPGERGVIASCSYAARQFGVHSAMPTYQALRQCPQLRIVRSGHRLYGQYSDQVMDILNELSGVVEQISIDEAFLDVSDLPDDICEIARNLQKSVREKTRLPCSLGAATNKLVAKIANDVGKARHSGITPPNAITIVPPGEEALFLAPLPIRFLWGVGPKMAEKLSEIGIRNIGELAAFPSERLVTLFGKWGEELSRHAQGIDLRQVSDDRNIKSISQEITFEKDIHDRGRINATIKDLSCQVGVRLRHEKYCGRTIRLKIRWSDFSTQTRQLSVNHPTDQDGIIQKAALNLLDSIWDGQEMVRLIGVGVSNLVEQQHQPSLWDEPDDKERRLLRAIDELHERFGENAISKATHLKSLNKNDK